MARGQAQSKLKEVVDDIARRMSVIERFGEAANHIEGLQDLETDRFGIAVLLADGTLVTGGEADTKFPIQSIAKVFSLIMALEAFGDEVWKRVGREPSGDSFGSIIDLERFKGIPRNPFINAGALVVIDMLLGRDKAQRKHDSVRDYLRAATGEKNLDYQREILEEDGKSAGFSNRALANLAKGFENLHHDVDAVMKFYVEQCAIEITCKQLARAGRFLMQSGKGVSKEDLIRARRVNAMMMSCGQYDGAGEFAFRVGLPAKSGVGGGILAIAPTIASIAVWSPALDDSGNSILGTMALEILSEQMGWSVFG